MDYCDKAHGRTPINNAWRLHGKIHAGKRPEFIFEIHGVGIPLILLHGGVGASGIFGLLLTKLAENRLVIAIHLQAHGRTADIDRPLSFELMADDINELLKHLDFEKANRRLFAWWQSYPADFYPAPEVVRKLVIVLAPESGMDGIPRF